MLNSRPSHPLILGNAPRLLFATAAFLAGCLLSTLRAQNQFDYTVSDGVATIVGYSGGGGNIVIPSTIDGFPIRKIAQSAFQADQTITGVEIQDGVEEIGSLAFGGCRALSTVTMANSVRIVGASAFAGTFNLPRLTLSTNLTQIGDAAFATASVREVTIPDRVAKIGDLAFSGCDRLASLHLGLGLVSIGQAAFSNCQALSVVDIPQSVMSVGVNAFSRCNGLSTVTIHDSPCTIGDGAFSLCWSLQSVSMGKNVSSIGSMAFDSDSLLTSISIPKSVKEIGEIALEGCVKLRRIDVDPENRNYTSVDGVLFTKNKSVLLKYPEGKPVGPVTVPDTVTVVARGALSSTRVSAVTLPVGLLDIQDSAFENSQIATITIPNSVTNLGSSALRGCSQLTNVTLGSGLVTIGREAFGSTSQLTNVTIPSSVRILGESPFRFSTGLQGVYFLGPKPVVQGAFVRSGENGVNPVRVFFLPGQESWRPDFYGTTATIWNPSISLAQSQNGITRLTITGISNITAVVEFSAGLPPTWTSLRTVGNTRDQEVEDNQPPLDSTARFYRLRGP